MGVKIEENNAKKYATVLAPQNYNIKHMRRLTAKKLNSLGIPILNAENIVVAMKNYASCDIEKINPLVHIKKSNRTFKSDRLSKMSQMLQIAEENRIKIQKSSSQEIEVEKNNLVRADGNYVKFDSAPSLLKESDIMHDDDRSNNENEIKNQRSSSQEMKGKKNNVL